MPTSAPKGILFKLIGQRVAKRRIARSMSQIDLARGVGVARTSITNLEGGRQRATLDHLYGIAEALNMELRDLIPSRDELNARPALGDDVARFLHTLSGPVAGAR